MNPARNELEMQITAIIKRLREIEDTSAARPRPAMHRQAKRRPLRPPQEQRLLIQQLEEALVESRKSINGGPVKEGTPCLYCPGSDTKHTRACTRQARNALKKRRAGMLDSIADKPMRKNGSASYTWGFLSVMNLGDMVD